MTETTSPHYKPEELERLRFRLGKDVPEDAVIRWQIRYRPPMRGKRKLRRVLPLWFQIVGRALAVVVGTGLLIISAFSLLWWAGSLTDHVVADVAQLFAGMIGFVVVVMTIARMCGRFKGSKSVGSRSMLVYQATIMLPVLMYSTAAPGAGGFSVFSGQEQATLWEWNLFFGYMLVDSVLLGIPQALVGELSSLQPATWQAAGMTFIIRTVMAIGLIAGIWDQVRDLIRGGYEVSLKPKDLLDLLGAELHGGQKVWITPLAVETPLPAGKKPIRGRELIHVPGADASEEEKKEWVDRSNPMGGRVKARWMLVMVGSFSFGLALIMAATKLTLPARESMMEASKKLMWIPAVLLVIVLLPLALLLILYLLYFIILGFRHIKTVRRAKRIQAIRRTRMQSDG